jgi:hypothetical protein
VCAERNLGQLALPRLRSAAGRAADWPQPSARLGQSAAGAALTGHGARGRAFDWGRTPSLPSAKARRRRRRAAASRPQVSQLRSPLRALPLSALPPALPPPAQPPRRERQHTPPPPAMEALRPSAGGVRRRTAGAGHRRAASRDRRARPPSLRRGGRKEDTRLIESRIVLELQSARGIRSAYGYIGT